MSLTYVSVTWRYLFLQVGGSNFDVLLHFRERHSGTPLGPTKSLICWAS